MWPRSPQAVPAFAQSTVDRAMLNGLIIEWPQA